MEQSISLEDTFSLISSHKVGSVYVGSPELDLFLQFDCKRIRRSKFKNGAPYLYLEREKTSSLQSPTLLLKGNMFRLKSQSPTSTTISCQSNIGAIELMLM